MLRTVGVSLSRRRDYFTTAGGGSGGLLSSWMHDERSIRRKSSAFSCGESAGFGDLQLLGNVPPLRSAPPPLETWMSVYTPRPHCFVASTPMGALNE